MKRKNYIYISIALIMLLFVNNGKAQGTIEFEVNGLKVIYKQVPKEIVSARLFVNGGTANYSVEQEGIENFAFNLAVTGGTNELDRIAFASELERMGTSIGAGSDYDYGFFNMICIKENWESSWNLFSTTIMNPTFDGEEYITLKEQLIAAAKQAEADPDESLRRAAMDNVFGGKNYAKIPGGTEASLNALSLEDLKNYYSAILGKDRSFLVVVGDLDLNDLKEKINNSFAQLPKGDLPKKEERIMVKEVKNSIEDRDIATNYIRGYMSAPTMEEEDGVAMLLAMSILRDRYFIELRTKRGLTYAPGAGYSSGIVNNPYNYIYVSTTNPKESIKVMVDELKKLKEEGFSEDELINKQQSFLTSYYMGQETLASQSNSLGVNELKGGWEMAEEFTSRVNNVSLEDINRVIDKYTDVIDWTYLGKASEISEEDFLQPVDLTKKMKVDSK